MSRFASASFVGSCFLAFIGFLAGVHHITIGMHEQHPNTCEMTYMRPHYLPLPMTTTIVITPEQQEKAGKDADDIGVTPGDVDQEATAHAVALMATSRLAYKYRIYRFENGAPSNLDAFKPTGFPVLFIHGSGGSYGQVRSIGAQSSVAVSEWAGREPKLDFFTLDFAEEPSGFCGLFLWQQAEFVNDAIAHVLSLYNGRVDQVIVVGHSMGGLIARAAPMLPNYAPNSIRTIITLSTPHRRPVVGSDVHLHSFYHDVNQFWKRATKAKANFVAESTDKGNTETDITETDGTAVTADTTAESSEEENSSDEQKTASEGSNHTAPDATAADNDSDQNSSNKRSDTNDRYAHNGEKESRYESAALARLDDVVLVAIAGGYRDPVVPSSRASFVLESDQFTPPDQGFAVLAYSIPGVGVSTDHLSILWCNQLMTVLAKALHYIAEAEVSIGVATTTNPTSQSQAQRQQLRHQSLSERRNIVVNNLIGESQWPQSDEHLAHLAQGFHHDEHDQMAPAVAVHAWFTSFVREYAAGLPCVVAAVVLFALADLSATAGLAEWEGLPATTGSKMPMIIKQRSLIESLAPWSTIGAMTFVLSAEFSRLRKHGSTAAVATVVLSLVLAVALPLLSAFGYLNFVPADLPGLMPFTPIQESLEALISGVSSTFASIAGVPWSQLPSLASMLALYLTGVSLTALLALLFNAWAYVWRLPARVKAVLVHMLPHDLIVACSRLVQNMWMTFLMLVLSVFPMKELSGTSSHLGIFTRIYGTGVGVLVVMLCIVTFSTSLAIARLASASTPLKLARAYRRGVALFYLVSVGVTLVPVGFHVYELLSDAPTPEWIAPLHQQRERRAFVHPFANSLTSEWTNTTASSFHSSVVQAVSPARYNVLMWELGLPVAAFFALLAVLTHVHNVMKSPVTTGIKVVESFYGQIEITEEPEEEEAPVVPVVEPTPPVEAPSASPSSSPSSDLADTAINGQHQSNNNDNNNNNKSSKKNKKNKNKNKKNKNKKSGGGGRGGGENASHNHSNFSAPVSVSAARAAADEDLDAAYVSNATTAIGDTITAKYLPSSTGLPMVELFTDTDYSSRSRVVRVARNETVQVDTVKSQSDLPPLIDSDAVPLIDAWVDADGKFKSESTRKKLRQRKLTQKIRKGPAIMPSDALYRWMLRGLGLVCLRASVEADVYLLGYVACAFAVISVVALNASVSVPTEDRTVVTVQVL